MSVIVHKAVEPDKLSVAGKKRYQKLLKGLLGEAGGYRALLQLKYDGVYAQAVHGEGGWQFYSRTGQLLKSVDEDIKRAMDANAVPSRRYNGELWLPSTQHAEINGRSRKQSPQYLHFVLFDSFTELEQDETLDSRMEYLFKSGNGVVHPASSVHFDGASESDLYDLAAEWKGRTSAYDGLMLKDLDGRYVEGRGKDGEFIKIKPRKSLDLRVVGTTEGVGNRKGGIGALIVDLGNGKTNEVGSGLTMADVFDREFTGLIVEVEYLSLTKDGHLREPVYKRIRHDKDEPDTLPVDEGDD